MMKDKKEILSMRKRLAKQELETLDLFSLSFGIYKGNFLTFFLLSMICGMPLVLFTIYFPTPAIDPSTIKSFSDFGIWLKNNVGISFYINILLSIISDTLVIVSVTIATQAMIYHKRIEAGTAISSSMKYIFPAILTYTMMYTLIVLGLTLFVLPGILLFVLLMFSINICAVRHTWSIKAFRYSALLVRTRFLKSFFIILIIFIFQNLLPVSFITGSINTREGLLSFFIANFFYYTFNSYFKIIIALYFLNSDYINSEKNYIIE